VDAANNAADKQKARQVSEFLTAIAVFALAHAIPPAPLVRARLIAWLGRAVYLVLYSLISIALIVWVVAAARRAPYIPLWEPAPWQALVPLVVMPIATWLLFAGLAEPNPFSISLRTSDSHTESGPAVAVTRHPVIWAILLWAGSHLPANGDVVSLILFGCMALLAIAGLAVLDRRARRRLGEGRWQRRFAATSLVPFAAVLSGRARIVMSPRLLLSIASTIAFYLWFLVQGHQAVIGVDPLAWFGW
jgi:uncharacterized membrane protein